MAAARQQPAVRRPKVAEPPQPVSPLAELDRQALAMMRNVDPRSPGGWQLLIGLAMRSGWTLQDIAEVFPCAVSTVSRWHAGKAGPPEFVRPAMKELLVQAVEKRLAG